MKHLVFTLIGIAIGIVITLSVIELPTHSNVDLPEEYQLITKDTPIQGHFEGKTLIIEFKHNYK